MASAHGAEKFIFQVTSPTTAGDIFFVNYANRRNRLKGNAFLLIGRLFLDLPVCSKHCTVNNCGGMDIHQDGQHATHHAKSRVIQRHDGVSRAIGSFFRHLARSELSPYSCNYEVELNSVDLIHHRPGKTQNLRCDFELVHGTTDDRIWTDVRITHPVQTEAGTSTTPLFTAEEHWKSKHRKYVSTYILNDEAVQPLVFEVYGGYASRTHDFLRSNVETIAAGMLEFRASVA